MINTAKCGCDCLNCPTYKENIKTIEDRKKCSAGWAKYLNINLSPEKLRACDGCSVPDSERKTYYLNCKIRKCAMMSNIDNCAYCRGFPCGELLTVHNIQNISDRKGFIEATGREISENDYRLFVAPYNGLHHLMEIREKLSEKDYRAYRKFSVNSKFAPFASSNNAKGYQKIVYDLLTSICVENNISYARLQTLKNKREKLIKMLWVMALYGAMKNGTGSLELDGRTFLSKKIQAMYDPLLESFEDLKKYDVHCEVISLREKGWLTPKGGLRPEGWIVRLAFGASLKGGKTLKVLKEYVRMLEHKYRDKAYKFFSRADFRIL